MPRQPAIPSTSHETTFTLPDNAVNIRLLYTSGKGAELLYDALRLGHNGIKKSDILPGATTPANYRAEVLVMRDYELPHRGAGSATFGMLQPAMQFVGDDYRYGLNGHGAALSVAKQSRSEQDPELNGEGNSGKKTSKIGDDLSKGRIDRGNIVDFCYREKCEGGYRNVKSN